MIAGLRMRQRVAVSCLATSHMATGQAYSGRGAHSAFGTDGAWNLERAVCLAHVRAFTRLDACHTISSPKIRIEVYSPRRIFIADRVFFINIAIVKGPTPPGTGVR